MNVVITLIVESTLPDRLNRNDSSCIWWHGTFHLSRSGLWAPD